jgi:hypothetical protein
MKSIKCDVTWEELISFIKTNKDLVNAKEILAWKLINMNERAPPVFFVKPKLYFPY